MSVPLNESLHTAWLRIAALQPQTAQAQTGTKSSGRPTASVSAPHWRHNSPELSPNTLYPCEITYQSLLLQLDSNKEIPSREELRLAVPNPKLPARAQP